MASRKTLLYFGALLHDVGKVMHRVDPASGAHAQLGTDFILGEVAAANGDFANEDGKAIAEQIRYHHVEDLMAASRLACDSLAYVTCFANLVATGMDRGNEGGEGWPRDVDPNVGLRSIFNMLNGHHDDTTIGHGDYGTIEESVRKGLGEVEVSPDGVNHLLGLLEATADSIPASTDPTGLIDVSLYDHAKLTAGIASCVYDYLSAQSINDYREALFGTTQEAKSYEEPMFLLFSCDMSGIQDFIYSISGSGALKQLRARSMYLELILEHIVDELLERLDLNRSNLLYTGGGHAYLLLPNTATTVTTLRSFGDELSAWFVNHFRTDLYVASAWVECSANDLANKGDKRRYPELYRRLSRGLSEAKAARYDAATIRALNFAGDGNVDHSRECSECHRSDLRLNKDNKCTLCAALGTISQSLRDKDVFVVDRASDPSAPSTRYATLELPFDCKLRMYTCEEYLSRSSRAHRAYAKNGRLANDRSAIGIWMGDYAAPTGEDGIADYACQSTTLARDEEGGMIGIRRLGVLRADVDDLGATFVSGLPNDRVSISRTSTLSRSLSYFFKYEINEVLSQGDYQVQIIYSGGDDLFVIGNWSDVIYAAMDIRKALDEYTGNGSLTISAGIGMFGKTYPIARMAEETGGLEDGAKHHPLESDVKTKNAIALWTRDSIFGWDEFTGEVAPRMREVREMFEGNQKGSSFIYRLIDLLRSSRDVSSASSNEREDESAMLLRRYKDVASAPRIAYLLARSFEDGGERGREASRRLYGWACDPSERNRLVAALEWYVYSVRNRSEQ